MELQPTETKPIDIETPTNHTVGVVTKYDIDSPDRDNLTHSEVTEGNIPEVLVTDESGRNYYKQDLERYRDINPNDNINPDDRVKGNKWLADTLKDIREEDPDTPDKDIHEALNHKVGIYNKWLASQDFTEEDIRKHNIYRDKNKTLDDIITEMPELTLQVKQLNSEGVSADDIRMYLYHKGTKFINAQQKYGKYGLYDTFKGIQATAVGGVAVVGDITTSLGKILHWNTLEETGAKLSEEATYTIKQIKEETVNSEDFFTPATLGKLAPTLATLPLVPASYLGVATMESLIAIPEAYGDGANTTEAYTQGAVAGTLGIAGKFVFRVLDPISLQKSIDSFMVNHKIDSADIPKLIEDYYKVNERTLPEQLGTMDRAYNKLRNDYHHLYNVDLAKALVMKYMNKENILEVMGNNKRFITTFHDKANFIKSITKEVKHIDIHSSIDDIYKGMETVKANYGYLANMVDDIPINSEMLQIPTLTKYVNKLEALDKIPPERAVFNLLYSTEVTAGDLIQARKKINSLLTKYQNPKTGQLRCNKSPCKDWKVLVDKVDSKLEEVTRLTPDVPEDWFIRFKEVNKDYSNYLKIKNSTLGNVVDEYINATSGKAIKGISKVKALQKFNNLDLQMGATTSLVKMIGIAKTEKFEKALINNVLGDMAKSPTKGELDIIATQLSSKSFISKEGKGLQDLLTTLDNTFPNLGTILKSNDDNYRIKFRENNTATSIRIRKRIMLLDFVYRIGIKGFTKEAKLKGKMYDMLGNKTKLKSVKNYISTLTEPQLEHIAKEVKLLER